MMPQVTCDTCHADIAFERDPFRGVVQERCGCGLRMLQRQSDSIVPMGAEMVACGWCAAPCQRHFGSRTGTMSYCCDDCKYRMDQYRRYGDRMGTKSRRAG